MKRNWIACPNDEVGCERIERNWPQLSLTAIGDPVVHRGPDGYTLGLAAGLPEFEVRQPIIGPDGVATTVYRRPPNDGDCINTELALASDGHWIGVQMIGEGAAHIFQPDGVPPSQALVSSLTSPSQRQGGGQNFYATQHDFGVGVELYDRQTNQKFVTPSPGSWAATVPAFVDDAAFLLIIPTLNQPDGWVWTRARGTFEPLLVRDPKHVLDVRGDGETLVWLESADDLGSGDWPPGELYTSPYTTVQANVVPTLRRSTPAVGPNPGAAIGGGYYVYYSGFTELIYIVRLSDARQWTMAAPVDEYRAKLSDISYVDDTYLYFRTQTEIYRQRLDALGHGTPP